MKTETLIAVLFVALGISQLHADIHCNSFVHAESVGDDSGTLFPANDLYLNTSGNPWGAGVLYCELESGSLHFSSFFPWNSPWQCIPGANDLATWVAPRTSVFADGDELAWLPGFSGDPDSAAASITFVPDLLNGAVPPWSGLAVRLLFSPGASGRLAVRILLPASDPATYTGTITDGRIDWPQPIPGDLTFDGFTDESDLDVLKEHWGTDPIILGDLGSGDPSYDGAVTSADLDIIRANWAASPPPASAVPEPGVLMLVALMLAFAGLGRRKQNASASASRTPASRSLAAPLIWAGRRNSSWTTTRSARPGSVRRRRMRASRNWRD